MANTYYVNNVTGNNSNSGRSTSEAWASISHAAGRVAAGDTVYVMDGGKTYYESPTLSRSGNSGNVITFKNYSGHSPTVDGKATGSGSGLPTAGNWTLFNPSKAAWEGGRTGKARAKGSGGLVKITGAYVYWDGINIKGSLSRGIWMGGNYCRLKNCTVGPNYAHNIYLTANHCEIDNVDVVGSGSYYPQRRGTTGSSDGCAAVTFGGAHYNTLKNSRIYNNWGESTICDANWGASSNNTIEDCYYWDNMKGCYIHGSTYITVQRCMFFRTQKERNQLKYNGNSVRGLSAGSIENKKYPDRDKGGKNLTFINNIFVGCGVAMLIKGSKNRDPMSNCLFANNTAVNCNTAWSLTVTNKNGMVFKNNIEYNNGTAVNGTSNSELGEGWTVDYNHWESAVHANATGANDVVGNPSLVNPGYTITGEGANANYDATRYRLQSGSTARGAAQDLSATFTTDFNSDTRSAWDMGAIEYDGNTAPTAAITASATSGSVPLSIDFEGDPNSMTSYVWEYVKTGTNTPVSMSTSQDHTYVFQDSGVYTVYLTVTDSNGLTSTDTETITAQAVTSGSAPLTIEQVLLDEGDATYTVSAATAPKAALYFWSGAASDDTATNNSQIGFGIAAGPNLATQYACGNYAKHGVTPTETARQIVSDNAFFFTGPLGTSVSEGSITTATATTVSISWTGSSNSEKITSLNFSGNAITNQSIQLVEPQIQNGTYAIAGNWNLAIMPFTSSDLDGNTGAQSFSFGFAKRGGNQACTAYHNRDNQATTDVRSATYDDRIAHSYRHGYGLQISSWNAGEIVFKTIDDDGNAIQAPVLLMHIDTEDYDFEVQIENAPTATGNNDYTANYGFDPQILLGLITNHQALNTTYTNDDAGVFGIFSVNGTPVDRTYLITSKDNSSSSEEKSYTDDQWVQLDEEANVIGAGAVTLITNGFRINPTTANSVEYKMPVLAIETSSSGSGLVASFEHDADLYTTTDTTVNFYDTSSGSPSSYDWDFGDGSGTSALQNPTYSWDEPGEYTVTLEIDGGGGLLTTTQVIRVYTPDIDISYTITPTSGAAPLTLELDASSSTTIPNRVIDDTRTQWLLFNMDDSSISYTAKGTETTVTILEPGAYGLILVMYHEYVEGDISTGGGVNLIEDDVVVVTGTSVLDFTGEHGQVTVAGEYEVDFTPTHDHVSASSNTYDWDFGDTNTDSTTGLETVTNTYSAVGSETSYDVELQVTYADGTTETVTKEGYITIVPAPTAPRTLSEMMTRLTALESLQEKVEEHMGIIDGTWSVNATYSNVYEITLDRAWANGLTVTVYEDGEALSGQANVADVAAGAGRFYTSFSDPDLTIYVRTTNTDNPGTNGSDYRFKAVT